AGLLEVESKKMSKSLGNIYTLDDLKQKGFEPLSLRYVFLTSHYRDKMNFTWKALEGAQTALKNLRDLVANLRQVGETETMVSPVKLEKVDKYRQKFAAAIANDLGIPQALAIVWEMLKSNIPAPDKLDLLFGFDQVLGLRLAEAPIKKFQVPIEIQKLVDEREKLRIEGKWQEADEIRKRVEKEGFVIEDTPEGPKIKGLRR
ncbi:cysteine--tRNA ligase, partial [Candidatus Gottesmanbacteria bacterium]|nr:cysteine--tRNA ligase [Candidatus Gottesmanbacteria bacterium]